MKYRIIIILSFLSYIVEAQKTDLFLAEKLLDKELAFFVSGSDSEKIALLMDKADLYSSRQEYGKALSELERAEKLVSPANVRLKYKKMFNYFLSDQFSNCLSLPLSSAEAREIGKEQEYFAMRFFSLNETSRWSQCKEDMLHYCAACDSSELRRIISLPVFSEYVSPLKCSRLSSFVPGLGMAKAGKPVKGLTSFLIQSGIAVFAGYSFYSGYYIAGVVSGVFPLLKFHQGGNRLSSILAENRNANETRKLQELYRQEIKKVLPQ